MTVARRLAAVEESLSPTQCVLRWVNEAHAYGSLSAYIDATLDQDPDDFPANRLCREAERAARRPDRSRTAEQIEQAVRKARREALFRLELVLRINVTAHELLEKDQLLRAFAAAHLALLTSESQEAPGAAMHRETLRPTLAVLLRWVTDFLAADQARAQAEQRYLESWPALFPDVRAAWDEQLRATQEVAAIAVRLAELDEVDLPQFEDDDAISARAGILLADLVEPPKVTAMGRLGEGEAALRIATGWLRARRDRSTAATKADSSPAARTL